MKTSFAVETRTAETSRATVTTRPTAAMTPIVQAISISCFPIYFFHHSGDGDQFVFDVFTVLGQQMERTLDWFDEADEEMTITCCGENGGEERKKCGGHNATNDNGETLRRPSCKDICGVGTQYIDSFSPISILTYFLFSDQISVCL